MPSYNADVVQRLVRDKLDAALPDNWSVYARRDFSILPADTFPLCYVCALVEQVLESETDNQDLIGYGIGVMLAQKETAVKRTDNPLTGLRRVAQQAVYTTNYTGLIVEDIILDESLGAELPGLQDGVTATGFTIVIGLLELREVATP